MPVMPRLLNDQSPARTGRSHSACCPVASLMVSTTNAVASGMLEIWVYAVAQRQPGLSQLTCATQFSSKSIAL